MVTDIHTHGLEDVSTSQASPEVFRRLSAIHKQHGTDRILPTLFPDDISNMRHVMSAAAKAMTATTNEYCSEIFGLHLEGPFLNPEYAGALDHRYFISPKIDSINRLLEGFENVVKIITIAPELPGALEVISRCVELGIRVSMGHSGATYQEALEGKQAGATGITHIFNAMRGIHHREPGLAGFGLTDPDVYIEVIADGYHLSDWTLELIFSMKPHDRIIPISDSVVLEKGNKASKGPARSAEGYLLGGSTALSGSKKTIEKTFKKYLEKTGINKQRIISDLFINNPIRYLGL